MVEHLNSIKITVCQLQGQTLLHTFNTFLYKENIQKQ